MNEIVMQSDEAIERVLNVLRARMQEAIKEKRSIHAHAKAGLKSMTEEDGSFAFTLLIDKRAEPKPHETPLDKRCSYSECAKEWTHERKSGDTIYRLCDEHNALVFPRPRLT